jgi:hypothetical protein
MCSYLIEIKFTDYKLLQMRFSVVCGGPVVSVGQARPPRAIRSGIAQGHYVGGVDVLSG